jgi:Protein of unknown function (DUF2695)
MDEAQPETSGGELRTLPSALATPLPEECLACYVWRMLDEFGCNATLRWARRWRDARAPRATALERRLARSGGCCDCELFLNVWVETTASGSEPDPSGHIYGSSVGPCRGVRRGSSQPCGLWLPGRL